MEKDNSQRGYAFLIVAIAIFIIAMLGITVLADFTIKSQQRRTDSTRLARVYRAIVGDPSTDTFGYLGDVGAYPTTFQDLLVAPSGATGWNGPYLNEDNFNGSIVNDSYGSPMEYDLNLGTCSVGGNPACTGDELAVVSKGPDHSSSNTASNPNDYTQWNPLSSTNRPSAGSTYTNASGNGDNLAYPDYSASPSTALQYTPAGTLDYNLVNRDLNQANALVPACPLEYNIVATSHSRGTSDTISMPWGPGVLNGFLQGLWDITIVSSQAQLKDQNGLYINPYFSESVAIYSGRTTAHPIHVEDIDTGKTTAYELSITNNLGKTIDVYDMKNNSLNSVKNNLGTGSQPNIAQVPACSTIIVEDHTAPHPVLGTWYTPWGTASTHVISSTKVNVTIANGNAGSLSSRRMIQVYANGLPVGSVYQRQSMTFTNIDSGASVVALDQTGSALGLPVSVSATTTIVY